MMTIFWRFSSELETTVTKVIVTVIELSTYSILNTVYAIVWLTILHAVSNALGFFA